MEDPPYKARRTLNTGADLLTDKQAARLWEFCSNDQHGAVEVTWGSTSGWSQRAPTPSQPGACDLMTPLITSVSAGAPDGLDKNTKPWPHADAARACPSRTQIVS